jgi:hypothetical protein
LSGDFVRALACHIVLTAHIVDCIDEVAITLAVAPRQIPAQLCGLLASTLRRLII